MVTILKQVARNWVKIKCDHDGYSGYVDPKQLRTITESERNSWRVNRKYCYSLLTTAQAEARHINVLFGSPISLIGESSFEFINELFQVSGEFRTPADIQNHTVFLRYFVDLFLQAPYEWGGRSPLGIDCSGLTQLYYRFIGVELPRDAALQIELGDVIDFEENSEPGDLAFFENSRGHIHHVGIIVEPGEILHASGEVRIDTLDHFGIYRADIGRYTHHLRLIKRMTVISKNTAQSPQP